MVEHHVRNVGVGSSNLLRSTPIRRAQRACCGADECRANLSVLVKILCKC